MSKSTLAHVKIDKTVPWSDVELNSLTKAGKFAESSGLYDS